MWFTPIKILVCFLAFMALGASLSWSGLDPTAILLHLRNFALIIGASALGGFVLSHFGLQRSIRWEHRAITSLILFVLFDPEWAWWAYPMLGLVTELIQRFFRIPGAPFFNPAAAGALVMSFIGIAPGWWGVSFAPRFMFTEGGISIAFFFTLAFAGFVAWKYQKLPIVLSAVLFFALIYPFLIGASPWYILLEGTFAFFLLVMAVEPKTSPVLQKEQIIYGGIIGISIPVIIALDFPEAYPIALLLANLYHRRTFLFDLVRNQASSTLPATPS